MGPRPERSFSSRFFSSRIFRDATFFNCYRSTAQPAIKKHSSKNKKSNLAFNFTIIEYPIFRPTKSHKGLVNPLTPIRNTSALGLILENIRIKTPDHVRRDVTKNNFNFWKIAIENFMVLMSVTKYQTRKKISM